MLPLPNRAPLTDDFNRANGDVNADVALDGRVWVAPHFTGAATMTVTSNQLKANANGNPGCGFNNVAKNHMVVFQIPAGAGGADHSGLNTPNNYWGCLMRFSQTMPATFGASSNFYLIRCTYVNAASDTVLCDRYVAGAGTAQTNLLATPSFDMVEGDWLAFACVEGNGGTYILVLRSTDFAAWTTLAVYYDTNGSRPLTGGTAFECACADTTNDPARIEDFRLFEFPDVTQASRLYIPSVGAPAISPAYDAGWEGSGNAVRRTLRPAKSGTAMTTSANVASAAVANSDRAALQGHSPPLMEGILYGHVKGQMRVAESSATLDARAQMIVRVLSNSGGAVRGTALAMDTSALSNEFVLTTLTNRKFPKNWAAPGSVLTPVQVQDGDILVPELGYRHASLGSVNSTFRFGDSAAADLAEDESTTTDNNPWLEFGGGLIFLPPRPQIHVVGQAVMRSATR